MSRWIDAGMPWLKWPVAVWLLLSVPRLLAADLALITAALTWQTAPLWLGLAAYLAVWWLILRWRVWGRLLPTLLHELTHGLFAVLTFHRILSLRATWQSGGEIAYTGPGNWLITIAPYFFPLGVLLTVPILALLQTDSTARLAVLGAVIGFEAVAMGRQLHPGQTDLQKVGFVFTAVFLPGALLWTWGALLALVLSGERGMLAFLSAQWAAHWRWLAQTAAGLAG